MTVADWKGTIDQLHDRGTRRVQFIGGEPTLHPGLPELLEHALGKDGMTVEVYTNMVHVNPGLKDLFAANKDRVSLATSYYSPDPAVHRQITGRNTKGPIQKNIRWAIENGMSLRVGIIDVQDGQNIEGAKAELVEMGIDPKRIGTDRMRQVGRGVRDEVTPETTSQLCGNCGDGKVAIRDGKVYPCVFAHQAEFAMGDLREAPLAEILVSEQSAAVQGLLREAFNSKAAYYIQGERFAAVRGLFRWLLRRPTSQACSPPCGPDAKCEPDKCNPCVPLTIAGTSAEEGQLTTRQVACEPGNDSLRSLLANTRGRLFLRWYPPNNKNSRAPNRQTDYKRAPDKPCKPDNPAPPKPPVDPPCAPKACVPDFQ